MVFGTATFLRYLFRVTSTLRFQGAEADAHRLRADELVRVVEHLQQIALLLAANRRGKSFKQRFRPATEVREQFQVVFAVPQQGSYALPWAVEDGRATPTLPLDFGVSDVETDIGELFRAVAAGDNGWLKQAVRDPRVERKLLAEVHKLLPAAGSPFSIEIGPTQAPVRLDAKARKTVTAWQAALDEEPTVVRQTFTGHLTEMNFDKRVITVSAQKREVECFYLDDVEPELTASRRQLVQITGVFTLGADGFPTKVTDVVRIEQLNLDPIHIGGVETAAGVVQFNRDLVFDPRLDEETGQRLFANDDTWSIYASGETRADLVAELEENLALLFDEYADVDPSTLTDDAIALQSLLEQLRRV